MTVAMGSYESSLRTRAIEARRRLMGGREPPPKIVARTIRITVPASEPEPVVPVERDTYRPIVRSIQYVVETESPFLWRKIVDEVCIKHKISMGQLCGRQRKRELVAARFEAYYRLSTETTMSLPQIGRRLGGKDHTSVMWGIKQHKERMEASK